MWGCSIFCLLEIVLVSYFYLTAKTLLEYVLYSNLYTNVENISLFQKNFDCCGIHKPDDWKNFTKINNSLSEVYCYGKEGCLDYLWTIVQHFSFSYSGVLLVKAVMCSIAIITSKQKSRQSIDFEAERLINVY